MSVFTMHALLPLLLCGLALHVMAYWYIDQRWRLGFLLWTSVAAILWLSPLVCSYLLVLITGVHLWVKRYSQGRRTGLALVLVLVIGQLAAAKFLLADTQDGSFQALALWPVGLSYVSFRLISYVVDCSAGRCSPQTLSDALLYCLFFPCFISGPIERYAPFFQNMSLARPPALVTCNGALLRMALGAAKLLGSHSAKAPMLAILGYPEQQSWPVLSASLLGLGALVYMNFSGSMDVVISGAKLYGIRLSENFDRPYRADNIAQFWRSWHITLQHFIRDYFYFPLFAAQANRAMVYLGLFCSMLVFHLWHAFTLNFFILGCYHGLGILGYALWQTLQRKKPAVRALAGWLLPPLLSRVLTIAFFCLGMVFFALPADQAIRVLVHLYPR